MNLMYTFWEHNEIIGGKLYLSTIALNNLCSFNGNGMQTEDFGENFSATHVFDVFRFLKMFLGEAIRNYGNALYCRRRQRQRRVER
jgi:hypothetical protein